MHIYQERPLIALLAPQDLILVNFCLCRKGHLGTLQQRKSCMLGLWVWMFFSLPNRRHAYDSRQQNDSETLLVKRSNVSLGYTRKLPMKPMCRRSLWKKLAICYPGTASQPVASRPFLTFDCVYVDQEVKPRRLANRLVSASGPRPVVATGNESWNTTLHETLQGTRRTEMLE